ncbi:ribosomal RNA-processing protein 7-domain-containing protein [Flagelloscypha sp. PMI_526]|nr:ribosomal RNA-processing protein 7-domain-containing protein [Flagelloscypha sp. PMI_526]
MEESGGDATDMTNLKLARQRKTRIPTIIPLPLPPQPLRRIRKTGKTAHVVFLDSSALESLSTLTKKANPWPISSESPSGLAHYVGLYDALRPPLDAVKKHVDSWMAHFAAIQARPPKSKYKKGEAIVDEDGFTLVTRGGAYGKTLGGGAAVASKKFEMGMESESQSKRKRKKEKRRKEDEDSFYGFKKADKQRKVSPQSF